MKERDLIAAIQDRTVTAANPSLLYGIGDDCAVTRKDDADVLLYSIDTLVESVHFDCAFHPPGLLGKKAVSVNVSDIAAMGGDPRFLLFSLGLPTGFDEQWVLKLSDGVAEACRQYGCTLIGGDTVASPGGINMSLCVIGEMAADQVLYRHGGREGDIVYVSGPLGMAAAGFDLLRHDMGGRDRFADLYKAHLDPRARVGLGKRLAASGIVHAMMDLSDGLATDLAHLCRRSKLGAVIYQDKLPEDPVLTEAAGLLGRESLPWMISGGEDYELLFTVAPHATKKLQEVVATTGDLLYPVGTMTTGKGVTLIENDAHRRQREIPIAFCGFDHFSTR
ncbi:MAG TPA: thiamine-phosphate kinase [Desulfobulbus sp.]|nr:thiamine-phosphate kinase [Desulfobulbus sp.]